MVLTVATVSALTEYRTGGFNSNKDNEDIVGVSVAPYNVCNNRKLFSLTKIINKSLDPHKMR